MWSRNKNGLPRGPLSKSLDLQKGCQLYENYSVKYKMKS